MKALPWILAGVGIGLAAYTILNAPSPQYSTGSDDLDAAAGETSRWGTSQRLSGTGTGVIGKVKEGLGRITGDDQLAGEGALDQVAGAVKDTAGKAAHAVSDTLHDLNR